MDGREARADHRRPLLLRDGVATLPKAGVPLQHVVSRCDFGGEGLIAAGVSDDLGVASHGHTVPYAHTQRKCLMHTSARYLCAMSTAAERLVQARTDAGCETAAEGAARADVKYYTYVQHESGTRGISKDKAERYGRAFGVDPSWLLYGRRRPGAPVEPLVPIIGYVGADPEGRLLFADGNSSGDEAPIPPGGTPKARAVLVRGHSMRGVADDGALLYFEDQRTPPTEDMLGYPCVVETEDGQVLVKRLLRGSEPGRYDLESISGPTLPNQRLRWAAEITAVIPPRQARRIIQQAGVRQVA